ncbi:hypothetical protein B0J18DRAFT_169919 [Chaetomium sp. MPI-SDFR-AT-0129]|nr:hypothetical protein B0J18DRAFT_169919 [Chaetomium sp. MPI-SDFR-AT-0129]
MEIGTIAAAAQLADMGCRGLFGIYRFLKNMKDVPTRLLLLLEDLGHFSSLMTDLQSVLSNHDPRLSNLSPEQLDRITRILDSTANVCNELEKSLTTCLPPRDLTRTSRVWRAFVSIKKEADIAKQCDRLERLKHDLARELQTQGLILLSSVKNNLGMVSDEMRQANVSLCSIENKLSAVDSVLEAMRVGLKDRDSTAPQTVKTYSGGTRYSVGIMNEAQLFNMNEMITEIHKCVVLGTVPSAPTQLHFQNASSAQRSQVLATSARRIVQYPQDLKTVLDRELIPKSVEFDRPADSWTTPNLSCRCARRGHRVKHTTSAFGPIRYNTVVRTKHSNECPLYFPGSNRETSGSLVFPLTLPFLSATIEFFYSSSWARSPRDFSIKYQPTVKRRDSLGFKAFREGLNVVYPDFNRSPWTPDVIVCKTGHYRQEELNLISKILEMGSRLLPGELRMLLRSGETHVNEKDEYGSTLLCERAC